MLEDIWSNFIAPLVILLGSLKLLILIQMLLSFFHRQFLRGKINHLQRYGGKGTWALVTGSTDGIGLEFARQLAKEGFNICLVSRTEMKLKAVVDQELKDFNVETRIIVGDFSNNANLTYYNDLMSKVSDLDIGLVVLNAGVANSGLISKIDIEPLQQMLDVNVY